MQKAGIRIVLLIVMFAVVRIDHAITGSMIQHLNDLIDCFFLIF